MATGASGPDELNQRQLMLMLAVGCTDRCFNYNRLMIGPVRPLLAHQICFVFDSGAQRPSRGIPAPPASPGTSWTSGGAGLLLFGNWKHRWYRTESNQFSRVEGMIFFMPSSAAELAEKFLAIFGNQCLNHRRPIESPVISNLAKRRTERLRKYQGIIGLTNPITFNHGHY